METAGLTLNVSDEIEVITIVSFILFGGQKKNV